ncbi:hypothetical protein GCM10022393_40460 [Aquimarina addita]|uniref:PKD domain-containing protein n=1 Tax=Aquimarina addita TaxID=870485 RepID=A0ABP6UV16_9FLAO
MIKAYTQKVTLFLFILISTCGFSQDTTPILIAESPDSFIESLTANKAKGLSLSVFNKTSLSLSIHVEKLKDDTITFIGNINDDNRSSFTIYKTNNTLEGTLIVNDHKKGYHLFTHKNGNVFLKEVNINTLVCVDFESVVEDDNKEKESNISKITPQLESLPGAPGIIYLDFDGEIVSETSWLSGATIDAQPAEFSDEKITEIWKIMAEDFRSFNFNVTTRRDLFDNAPNNRRMMVIFTPTKDVAPTSGGIAYVRSFAASRTDNPCWVFNLGSSRAAGETGSHEVGHTLGLSHDGDADREYYSGHGQWSPIMGWSVNRALGHWSKGEYIGAVEQEDDIAIIAGSSNGVGFRDDDHQNVITEATPILVSSDGNVSSDQNYGFIHNRDDKDVFSFVIETGNVSFNFEPNPDYPNLNIQARILNGLGEEVAISDPSGLSANINEDLTFGTYFIEIDGVGEGDLITGYSDYSSIGNYFISGNYTPGNNNQPPIANFDAAYDCSTVDFNSTSINNVNTYLWNFGDGETSTEQNPTHTYTDSGTYSITLTTSNSAGQDTRERNNFITISIPEQPIGEDARICIGESTVLTVSGNSNFDWYDSPNGGSLVHQGATFETPILESDKTYYVSGSFDSCTTDTRTEVHIIVEENLPSPEISIPDTSDLTVASIYTQYQWYVNGELINGADKSTYTPDQIGDYSVEVFNETGCNAVSSEFSVDLSQLNLSQGTSLFKYYPNPASDILYIDGLTVNETDIRIVNALGQVMIESSIEPAMEVTNLFKGMYIILINNKYVGKFVKL